MRIRRKSSSISAASPSSSSSFYSSPSPSPASSNYSSSSITTNSLASSIDSTSSSSSTSSTPPNFSPFSSTLTASSSSKRCQGLDLLVKAIHLVTAGSVVGVPYIQRRVVRRRKAALKFNGLVMSKFQVFNQEPEQEEMKDQMQSKTRLMSRRQSRAMGLPSKHQDSVLQQWMLKNRRLRSIKIGDGMCS